jgi:hypothetical protein
MDPKNSIIIRKPMIQGSPAVAVNTKYGGSPCAFCTKNGCFHLIGF